MFSSKLLAFTIVVVIVAAMCADGELPKRAHPFTALLLQLMPVMTLRDDRLHAGPCRR
jgi:hypothetical protein